jgi:hypothetical protein
VAVRNKPGRMSSFSWFKIWEPDGTSTVEGPLSAPSGWAIYVYPLGFDITADGSHLVYGYANSSFCCPSTLGRGIYVRPATTGASDPIETSGQTSPSLFGSRIVSLEDASAPKVVNVQNADGGNPYTSTFTPWIGFTSGDFEIEGVDVAANGRLAALGLEAFDNGTQTAGTIAVLAIQGVDQEPSFPAAVDCSLPAAGFARDASLSQDAGTIAWKDGAGVKVAGTPTTAAEPCALASAPVVLSPTGAHPSIGGADVSAFLPKPPVITPPVVGGSGAPGGATLSPPVVKLPAKVTVKALAASRGVPVRVTVSGPGKVAITGTVPARRVGRRGKPVVVATGKASPRAAGTVTVRLRLTAVGHKRARRLKGARLALRIVQGSRSTTKTVKLR